MAETKDKLVNLEDLKVLSDDTTAKLGGKLAVPLNEGTQGQVLTAKGDGTSEWADAQGGSLEINENKILLNNKLPVSNILFTQSTSPIDTDSGVAIIVENDDVPSATKTGIMISSGEAFSVIASGREHFANQVSEPTSYLSLGTSAPDGGRVLNKMIAIRYRNIPQRTTKTSLEVYDNSFAAAIGYLEPSLNKSLPGLCKGDETSVSMETYTGTLSVKDGGITMSHLAQDVKDAISAGGGGTTVDEATIRRIVNEQLAKMKFTINDQGHLIIETPEA